MPEDRNRLTMVVIVGSRTDRHCLRSDVRGTGSRSQYLSREERTAFATSSRETVLNCKRVAGAEVDDAAPDADVIFTRNEFQNFHICLTSSDVHSWV